MDRLNAAELMARVEAKVDRMIGQIGDKCPHFAGKEGVYDNTSLEWWTSGFWPGLLWVMHGVTGKAHYKEAAWHWDERLERWFIAPDGQLHHDVGFQFLPTAVIKYKETGDKDGLRRGLEAANYLAGRFNPAGNFIRAWNGDRIGWAIVDCMMNIPLLFWASEISQDPRFKHIAMRHADTALRVSVRDDGSVNHIVSFDPESGEFIEAIGGQGLAADSAWSRGTAWGLHGFALAYRWTGEVRYLNAAKRIAHYFLAALPEDSVPYWDFRLESTDGEPRDSSAAAIAASGLLEIAESVPAAERSLYAGAAERILLSLTERYATWDLPAHEAILTAATGHRPAGNFIDGSLIYGDYYYVEAIAKLCGWRSRVFAPVRA
ncbi:glycoside hydrolase family 88 protein [Paenibacillus humicola]|uniref:glycoside hydrolase family 88 protein n=1 Tax=Paenibacillus humicola TaxID=3110540 RepID=UPI00237AADD6|nr:glycoside hydrolase family 88 protein [Paenibacillus humicola]